MKRLGLLFNHMVDNTKEQALSDVMKAMSDTTRRSLMTQLVQQGPTRVTDLARFYEMSLNAISKHIKVLEKAGLVTRTLEGRQHWITANLEPVKHVESWFTELQSIWAMSLDKLEDVLTNEEQRNDGLNSKIEKND